MIRVGDPTLSDKTISLWWMPTQVCWHPDSSLPSVSRRSFLFICIIPVTLRLITTVWFAYLCLKLRADTRTINTVRRETNCGVWLGWGISGERDERGIFSGSVTHTHVAAHAQASRTGYFSNCVSNPFQKLLHGHSQTQKGWEDGDLTPRAGPGTNSALRKYKLPKKYPQQSPG